MGSNVVTGSLAQSRLMSRHVLEANLDHPAHGKNLRDPLGLESHFGPVRHELIYCIAPKITQTQSAVWVQWVRLQTEKSHIIQIPVPCGDRTRDPQCQSLSFALIYYLFIFMKIYKIGVTIAKIDDWFLINKN